MPAKSLCSVFCMRRTSKVLKLIFHFSNAIQSVFRMSCNFFIPRALTSYFSSGAEARRADGFDLTMSYLLGRRASLFLQACIKMRFFRWAARCARTRNVLFLSAIKFAFFWVTCDVRALILAHKLGGQRYEVMSEFCRWNIYFKLDAK